MIRFFNLILILLLIISKLFAFGSKNNTYINTNNIEYDEENQIIELGENSLINLNETNIYTNDGFIDFNNDELFLKGRFYLYQDLIVLTGLDLEGNTNLTEFHSSSISYVYNNDLKVDSKYIKRSDNIVYLYDNFLSPCEIDGYFGCPTWSLKVPKTKYLVKEDKFIHYDSFIQIADKKIFYLPYFSHYGSKAPRKSGFLTPTLEFNLLGVGTSFRAPYYLPVNQSIDFLITPKFTLLPSSFEISENYQVFSVLTAKLSGGEFKIDTTTTKNQNDSSIYNSSLITTSQIINKNLNFNLSSRYTNSISSTRANNENQIPFENSYLQVNKYNVIKKNDILVSEINTVTAFDNVSNELVPYEVPKLTYINFIDFENKTSIQNYFEISNSKRNGSNRYNPSENLGFLSENRYFDFINFKRFNVLNNFIIKNNYEILKYEYDPSLNTEYLNTTYHISSDFKFTNFLIDSTPRLKFILNKKLSANYASNQNSQALSFNYHNLFQESRFFGNDLLDNSQRIAYGIGIDKNISNKKITLNIGQSYDLNSESEYLRKINQNSKFSDYVIDARMKINDYILNLGTRLNNITLSQKEMNYSIIYNNDNEYKNHSKYKLELNYNKTSKDAYLEHSDDSESININIEKYINDNIKFNFYSNLDIKNNYYPFKSNLILSIFDECSQFDINYTNTKFSDNFNTIPTETIAITFRMDYLGFFGYEQKTDLFLSEPGNLNYGL